MLPTTDRVRVRERLAEFRVTLFCPADLDEEEQDGLCAALDYYDFRAKIEAWLRWYTLHRRVLRDVTVRVDE
jgi:hypothetical protein